MFGVSQTFPSRNVQAKWRTPRWNWPIKRGEEENRKRGWKRITITGSTNDSEEERRIGSNEKAVVRLIRKDEIHSTNKPDFSWGREEGLEEVRHAWDYVRHSPRLYRASEYTVTDLIAFPATTSRIHFFFSLFLLNLFDFRIKVSKVYIYFRISFIYFRVKIFLFPDVVVGRRPLLSVSIVGRNKTVLSGDKF